uniref:Mast cell immunoglobulin like receptor 1 n=1 Tax=Ailuropoda melanoleuca TaxID=9646 RepID=A0A7N5KAG7_AILME
MTHPPGGTTPPLPSFLISSERMWRPLNKLFFWGIFSSLTLQKAALDCDMTRTNKLLSPSLDSETKVVLRGQNVSLICSNQNKSLRITYVLFRHEKHLRTHDGKGEPMIFNLSISEAHELGPYKCKAQVSNCSVIKYSREFNFTFVDPVITPVLNIHVINIETDRHIILRCISFNGSLPITYTFFEKDIAISQPISKHVREPAELNITKNNTGEGEEYRCKAKNKLPDHERYSQPVFINPPPGKGYLSSVHRVWICFQKLQLLLCPPTSPVGHLHPNAFPLGGSTQTLMGFLSADKRKRKSLEARSGSNLAGRLPNLTLLPAFIFRCAGSKQSHQNLDLLELPGFDSFLLFH